MVAVIGPRPLVRYREMPILGATWVTQCACVGSCGGRNAEKVFGHFRLWKDNQQKPDSMARTPCSTEVTQSNGTDTAQRAAEVYTAFRYQFLVLGPM